MILVTHEAPVRVAQIENVTHFMGEAAQRGREQGSSGPANQKY